MNDDDYCFDRTISIRARPTTVWRFLSEAEGFAQWWGEGSTIEARVGAAVRIVYPGGSTASGEVLEVVPLRRIVFSFGYDDPSKPIAPGGSRVSLELHEEPDGTRVELRHHVATEALRELHAAGWRYHLAVFARVVHARQHADVEAVLDDYFAAWGGSPDDAAACLDRCTAPDVRFADAMGYVHGRSELAVHIAAARAHAPGIALVRQGCARVCQGTALADWELRLGEQAFGRGTNVFELDADGRIASVVGIPGS